MAKTKKSKTKVHTLDVLVPYYNEGKEVIKKLLDSIMVQRAMNFTFDQVGVIICRDSKEDNGARLTEDFLNSYPFKIKYIEIDHQGVSTARQTALDASKAEYVSFSDSDDCYFSACAFWLLFREMQTAEFDALVSVFLEESKNPKTGEFLYINHQTDQTFVHGKLYRRQYLIDNDIRWNPDLHIHEDSYFNIQCQKLTDPERVKYCPYPFFLWCWRDVSVCRHDPDYILHTYRDMIKTMTALVDTFLKKKHKKEAIELACFSVYDAYFTLNKREWHDFKNKEYRDEVEHNFYELYKSIKYLYDQATEEVKNITIMGIKNRMFSEGLFLEKITFDDWIDSLKQKYDKQ